MKILLINPPKDNEFSLFVSDDYNKKARSNQVPLGLLYIKSYLDDFSACQYNTKILDMNDLEIPTWEIKEFIADFQPDIIGITCVISKWMAVKELAQEIKRYNTNINIVLGGVHPSLYPWETLQCTYIDYVVSGFGQIPFADLCFSVEFNDSTEEIPDVFTRKNFPEKIKGSFILENVDSYPMPVRSEIPISHYTMPFFPENPVTSMITSSGCPYKCGFCASKNFKPVIIRETEAIIAELEHIQKIGIKGVLFNDELFTMNPKRIKEICSAMIIADIKLAWSVRSRANLVNLEALKLMKKAGCFNVHLGIESGTDRILDLMRKGIDIRTIRESVKMIKSAGLSVTASFMIGYPDETEDEIMKTLQFAKSLQLNSAQFFIVQPEPGTELYEEVKEIKGLPDDIYSEFTLDPEGIDLTQNIASNIFTKDELEDFIKHAYSLMENLYNIKESSDEDDL